MEAAESVRADGGGQADARTSVPGGGRRRAALQAGAAFAGLAAVTVAVAVLNGFVPDSLYTLTPDIWARPVLLGILPYRLLPLFVLLVAALLAAGVAALSAGPRLPAAAGRLLSALDRHGPAALAVVIALAAAAGLVVAMAVLRGFPNSGDEYAYVFQAMTFLEGWLWQEVPPRHEFFEIYQIFAIGEKWISQYSPGWPLVLAAGMAVGLPAEAVGPLCGAVLIGVLGWLARDVLGWGAAVAVCAVVLVSGFFLLNAGSHFNHVMVAALMLGFTIAVRRFLDRPGAAAALAAGACLGMIGITRYFSAILCFLPALAALAATRSWRHYLSALWAVPAILPFLAGLLAYNQAVTGSPLTTVTALGYPALRLGLWGMTEAGVANSPFRAAVMAATQLTEFMEWTSPLALGAYAVALGYLLVKRKARFHDVYFLVFVLGFLVFPSVGGNRYGPRYYFEAYPFLVLTVATALDHYLRTAAGAAAGAAPGAARGGALPGVLAALAAAHLVIAAFTLPALLLAMNRVVVERMDPYDQVAAAGLDNAVVFIASDVGVLRPMPKLDLTRNGTRIGGPVVYARDLGAYNLALRTVFPDRSFWRYSRRPGEPRGRLVPWRPKTAAPAAPW